MGMEEAAAAGGGPPLMDLNRSPEAHDDEENADTIATPVAAASFAAPAEEQQQEEQHAGAEPEPEPEPEHDQEQQEEEVEHEEEHGGSVGAGDGAELAADGYPAESPSAPQTSDGGNDAAEEEAVHDDHPSATPTADEDYPPGYESEAATPADTPGVQGGDGFWKDVRSSQDAAAPSAGEPEPGSKAKRAPEAEKEDRRSRQVKERKAEVVELSSAYEEALRKLDSSVQTKLRRMIDDGKASPDEVDMRSLEALSEFSPASAVDILEQYATFDKTNVRNKASYLMGFMKRYRSDKEPGGGSGRPTSTRESGRHPDSGRQSRQERDARERPPPDLRMSPALSRALDNLYRRGAIKRGDLDDRCFDYLQSLPESIALDSLYELSSSALKDVRNISAFFMTVCRRNLHNAGDRLPPQRPRLQGPPQRPGYSDRGDRRDRYDRDRYDRGRAGYHRDYPDYYDRRPYYEPEPEPYSMRGPPLRPPRGDYPPSRSSRGDYIGPDGPGPSRSHRGPPVHLPPPLYEPSVDRLWSSPSAFPEELNSYAPPPISGGYEPGYRPGRLAPSHVPPLVPEPEPQRLQSAVASRIQFLFDQGVFDPRDFDDRAWSMLAQMPEIDALAALDELEAVGRRDMGSVRNLSAYFMGIARKYGSQRPPAASPRLPPMRNGGRTPALYPSRGDIEPRGGYGGPPPPRGGEYSRRR
eukprot:jgi/Chlat1/1896/Chrsp146S02210